MERRAQLLRTFREKFVVTTAAPQLEVLEHASASYSPRTYANAHGADLTVAFAVDFETAGERLTHKASAGRYVGIPLASEPLAAARLLYKALRGHNAHSLNVAGNGIYTLAKHGWSQDRVNEYVHAVLAKVHEHWPLERIRSGGQTGIDIAGVAAAHALGINATAFLPHGFIQRGIDKKDVVHSADQIRTQIEQYAARLLAQESPGKEMPVDRQR